MNDIHVSFYLLSPLCHGGFDGDTGNAVIIRREPIVGLPGMPRIPCLSGNSIRGKTRRNIMRDLFGRVGFGVGALPGRQWDLLYGALANGGHLTGKEKNPSPDKIRELRVTLPPLSVLGAAMYHYLLPGRVQFGFGWPVCTETVAAGLTAGDGTLPAGDLVTETGIVRHIDRDQQDPEKTGVTPMPITIEGIATGSEIQSTIKFPSSATEVERSAIAWGLSHIDSLGGRGAGGVGQVRCEHDGNPDVYEAWVTSTGVDEIRSRLSALAKEMASA